ncbi:MAG: hypothetical protein DLM62_00995 [Pseudonocardiales bacterium]|nr:MAG: hypothetical protein DLM62_00995 [Pseudonocardiales bacterium]
MKLGKPECRPKLMNLDDHQIISIYGAEYRGGLFPGRGPERAARRRYTGDQMAVPDRSWADGEEDATSSVDRSG